MNRIELAAQIAHETNRAYCQSIGDQSQPPWESAPDWQRDSAIKGVAGVLAALPETLAGAEAEVGVK